MDVGQNTKTILELYGKHILEARKLRMLTTKKLAENAGIARSTSILIEEGAPGIAIGPYIQVMNLLGLELRLIELVIWNPHHLALKIQTPNF